MIDWHSHILPGIDDGVATDDEALEMGQLLVRFGFTDVHCTPHCLRGMYDNRPADVREACAAQQELFRREGVVLTLHPGMEYCLDEFFPDYIDDLLPLGSSRYVLVETPSRATTDMLKENLFLLRRAGYEPLFAHPERHAFLAPPRPEGFLPDVLRQLRGDGGSEGVDGTPLQELIGMGCHFQCNLGSLGGFYGDLVRKQACRFLTLGLYRCIGSDLHNGRSETFLRSGLDALSGADESLLYASD